MPDRSSRHQAALDYATAGIRVFPCKVGLKDPLDGSHGFKDATLDLTQINAWWAEADYNVAMCPDHMGWAVVDIEHAGIDAWAKYSEEAGGYPDTHTVQTARGGYHLYFKGSTPSSARRLFKGEKIDTRGRGGYVMLPPSTFEGKSYEVVSDSVPIAELPNWIADRLARNDARSAEFEVELDTPASIARARSRLRDLVVRGDVAVAGNGGNNRTFTVAAELSDLGLSPERSHELLSELWNPHCLPPWDEQELATICRNASEYKENDAGIDAVASSEVTFAHAAALLAAEPAQPEKRSRFHLETEEEMDSGKEPSWLVKNVLQQGTTALLVGPSQQYKSFIALDLALGIATGVETFGQEPVQGVTVYAALEGGTDIKKRRRKAWRLAHSIEGRVNDFYVTRAPMIAMPGEVQEFGDEIAKTLKGRPCRLIVLDTLAKCMAGLDESHARDAGQFIQFCDSLVEAFGCTVLVLHHSGKDAARGARGSSAFQAGFDTVLEVKGNRDVKTATIYVRKHKDADDDLPPWTFQGKPIAGSLVFQPTTAAEHRALTAERDTFSPMNVGGALYKLGARGPENGVTTDVLATEMVSGLEEAREDSAEDRQKRIKSAARVLAQGAKFRLEGYVSGKGRDLVWSVPRETEQ